MMSTFKLCICIMIGLIITCKQVSGGQVIFRDGLSSTSGRVEVKPGTADTDWGNICSDDFDIIDADVICRQLDYAWALYMYNVSDFGTKSAVISNLECDGDEINIFDCEHEDTDVCEGVPGVGIECIDLEYRDMLPIKNLRIVPAGSEDDAKGKLEILESDENWKPICSNEWDNHDTATACRQLGFAFAVDFDTYTDPGYMGGIYRDFDCNSYQGYLLACEHNKGPCEEYVKVECWGEIEEYSDYNSGEEPYESDYYPWLNESPCDDFNCENGGECYIDEYFDAVCDCPAEWKGDHCELPADDGINNNNNNNPPTDPPASSSDDVIIYAAIGAGVFVLLVATFVIIYVTYTLRRRRSQRSTAKKPVEIGLKGKPVTENRRNNNSYQQPTGVPKPAQNKPTSPPTEYYLEPSSDYAAPAEDYTALAPASEIYDEIPYDTIDNGGYMDLQPSEVRAPPELPKPR